MHYGTNSLAKGTAKEISAAMGSKSAVKVFIAMPEQPLTF